MEVEELKIARAMCVHITNRNKKQLDIKLRSNAERLSIEQITSANTNKRPCAYSNSTKIIIIKKKKTIRIEHEINTHSANYTHFTRLFSKPKHKKMAWMLRFGLSFYCCVALYATRPANTATDCIFTVWSLCKRGTFSDPLDSVR